MKFTNIGNKNIIIFLFFYGILIVGLNVYKDYGLTLDDESYRKNGELSYEYIKNLFSNKSIFALNGLESFSKKII